MKLVIDKRVTTRTRHVSRDYARTASEEVAHRFRNAVDEAIWAIARAPAAAGHLIHYPPDPKVAYRRRNLRTFPFFIIYSHEPKQITLLWLRASRSNPELYFTES